MGLITKAPSTRHHEVVNYSKGRECVLTTVETMTCGGELDHGSDDFGGGVTGGGVTSGR